MPRPKRDACEDRPPVRSGPWPSKQVKNKPDAVTNQRFFAQSVVSPLRYPGAKRQLVPIIEQIVTTNIPPPRLFVEPFCGGASTALRLVGTGIVEHAILADADDLVASFWYTAAFDTEWLVEELMKLSITVERWKWWRLYQPTDVRDKALKCLFLNRTTFSGILHGRAGPIGGKRQGAGTKYPIDCRFNKQVLAERIRAIGELADTGRLLDVWTADWRQSLARLNREYGRRLTADEILVYFDPPYVEKAQFLYQWSFESEEHRALAARLQRQTEYRWLLSYDDNPLARELYPPAPGRHVLHAKHRYSAAGLKATAQGKRQRAVREELLVTNFPDIPESEDYHTLVDQGCESCRRPLVQPPKIDSAAIDT